MRRTLKAPAPTASYRPAGDKIFNIKVCRTPQEVEHEITVKFYHQDYETIIRRILSRAA